MYNEILRVPEISLDEGQPWPEALSLYLSAGQLVPVKIQVNSWREFQAPVEACFSIAHTGQAILLRFDIKEDYLKAVTGSKSKVSDDSCVEFFISFDGLHYYNLEFGVDGTYKIAYGRGRRSRTLIENCYSDKIDIVRNIIPIRTADHKKYEWQLSLMIPGEVFSFTRIESFKGLQATANFYKCGDNLPQPHYLSWKPIWTKTPDFHQIDYFGKIHFL